MAPKLALRTPLRSAVFLLSTLLLAPPTAGASSVTLESALAEARRSNPELRALRSQAEAAGHDAGSLFYLPPPMLRVGSMGMDGLLATEGHMQTSLQVVQVVPFPTKVAGRREALHQNAQAAQDQAEARWLELQTRVRLAYLDYWRSREARLLLEDKLRVLADHTKRLKTSTLQTQMMQAHLVSVVTDQELVKTELEAVRAQESAARGELNALMGKDAFEPLGEAAEPQLSTLPAAPGRDRLGQVSANHPEVREAQRMLKVAEAEKRVARSEWLPDFALAYRRNNNTTLAAEPSNSELMFEVSLPFLYFWQPAAVNRAASVRQAAAEAQLDSRRNKLKLQLLRKHSEAASLYAQYTRFRDSVLKNAEKRLHIAHGIAPTDTESFNEHRESTEGLVDLKLKALDLRVAYEKSVAEYESALGESFALPSPSALSIDARKIK